MNSINTPILLARPSMRLHGFVRHTSFQHAAWEIPAFWGEILGADLLGLQAKPRPVVAAYTDYTSDFRGAYSLWLTTEASPGDVATPTGHSELVVPTGLYACFAADGDPTQVIWKTWQWINESWPERGRRNYRTDFEIHGVRGPNTADICVGMRAAD